MVASVTDLYKMSPRLNEVIFETSRNLVLIWDGHAWVNLGGPVERLINKQRVNILYNGMEQEGIFWHMLDGCMALYVTNEVHRFTPKNWFSIKMP
jgi:hypothetical protein